MVIHMFSLPPFRNPLCVLAVIWNTSLALQERLGRLFFRRRRVVAWQADITAHSQDVAGVASFYQDRAVRLLPDPEKPAELQVQLLLCAADGTSRVLAAQAFKTPRAANQCYTRWCTLYLTAAAPVKVRWWQASKKDKL